MSTSVAKPFPPPPRPIYSSLRVRFFGTCVQIRLLDTKESHSKNSKKGEGEGKNESKR